MRDRIHSQLKSRIGGASAMAIFDVLVVILMDFFASLLMSLLMLTIFQSLAFYSFAVIYPSGCYWRWPPEVRRRSPFLTANPTPEVAPSPTFEKLSRRLNRLPTTFINHHAICQSCTKLHQIPGRAECAKTTRILWRLFKTAKARSKLMLWLSLPE